MATTRGKVRLLLALSAALAMLVLAACGNDDDNGGGGDSGGGGKIALLLPETKTTRYEEQDKPNFERHVKELCSDCEVIYSNANQDPAKQQQQAEAAITDGRQGHRDQTRSTWSRPARSCSERSRRTSR